MKRNESTIAALSEFGKCRVYIAGPITGMPDYNRAAFMAAEKELIKIGYRVFNPVAPGPDYPGLPRHVHLKRDIIELTRCDCVALLPGYKGSFAETEVNVALGLGLPVFHLKEGFCVRSRFRLQGG